MLDRHSTARTSLFVISVGRGNGLRNGLLLEDERKPVQVRLVAVSGCEIVWGEWRAAACGPERAGGREGEPERELGICRKTKVGRGGSVSAQSQST